MAWRPDGAPPALVRLVVAALVLGSLAALFQERLVGAALPLFRAWLGWVDTTYRTVELSIVEFNGEPVVQRIATPAGPHAVGDRVVYNDPRTRISTQVAAGIALQPLVLAAALLVAWPWRSALELTVRAGLAAALLLAIELLDIPLALYGVAWSREVALLAPDHLSPLACWADFMNAGGRFALTVAATALAVHAGSAVVQRTRQTVPTP